ILHALAQHTEHGQGWPSPRHAAPGHAGQMAEPVSTAQTAPPAPARVRLDGRNQAIIVELQRDGRASFAAIGETAGLSGPAVRRRSNRLIAAGAIRVPAVAGPQYAAANRLVVVGIRCAGDVAQAGEVLSALAELRWLALTAGAFDMLA